MKKCGFFDCNNPAESKSSSCLSCKDREEGKICSACRQKEKASGFSLILVKSFAKSKKTYEFISKLRNKVPAKFHARIDQILPQLKLNQKEEQIIEKMEKVYLDFVEEKGGKQDNLFDLYLCSDCNLEIEPRTNNFAEQNPEIKDAVKKLEPGAFIPIFEEIGQEIGEENLDNITDEIEEELFGKPEEEDKGKPDKKNKQKKISQLQQEINRLQQQLDNLNNNPSPRDSDTAQQLQRIKDMLGEKEAEIERLKNLPSNDNDQSTDNPKWPLYFILPVGGIIILSLALFLVFSKKKKKTNLNTNQNIKYAYHK